MLATRTSPPWRTPRKLGLKSNALAQLPSSFTRLTRLVELFITDNELSELPQGAHPQGVLRALS